MKIFTAITILILTNSIGAYSQNTKSYFLSKSDFNTLSISNERNLKKEIYFAYLDLNDCFNCNLAFNVIVKNSFINKSQIVLVINNLPKYKIPAFRLQLGISDSIQIITESSLIQFFMKLPLEKTGIKKSLFCKFNNTNLIYYTSLTLMAQDKELNTFIANSILSTSNISLSGDSLFYSSFTQAEFIDNAFFFITAPNPSLIVFNTEGAFSHKFSFPDSTLITIGAKSILSRFHDSIQNNGYNSIDSIAHYYNVDIKPLGFPILKFNHFIVHNDTICVSGSISLPITTSFEKITLASSLFIFKFTKKLNLVAINEYQIDIDSNRGPIDIYGFYLNEETLKMSLMNFNQKAKNPYFIGNWKLDNSKKYKYSSVDSALYIPIDSTFEIYFSKIGQLLFKFTPINDSILSFHYYPFLLNTNTNKLIPLFENINNNYVNYKNELFTKVIHNNKLYYVMIEHIDKNIMLSILDTTFTRISSSSIDKNLQKKIKLFLIKNNDLIGVSYDDEGTTISKLDYLHLFPN